MPIKLSKSQAVVGMVLTAVVFFFLLYQASSYLSTTYLVLLGVAVVTLACSALFFKFLDIWFRCRRAERDAWRAAAQASEVAEPPKLKLPLDGQGKAIFWMEKAQLEHFLVISKAKNGGDFIDQMWELIETLLDRGLIRIYYTDQGLAQTMTHPCLADILRQFEDEPADPTPVDPTAPSTLIQ